MESAQGIVIRTTDYKEKDKLLTLFTARGIITLNAKSVRSEKAKLKAYANPLTFGEFSFSGKAGNKILSGIEFVDNFYTIWADFDRANAAFACFELAEKGFRNEEETVGEFLFLIKTIKEIAYGQTEPLCSVIKFALYCAQRLGADYTEIEGYDRESYELLKTFESADTPEVGTLPFTMEKVRKAFLLLHNVFKNYLGITISSLKNLIKA